MAAKPKHRKSPPRYRDIATEFFLDSNRVFWSQMNFSSVEMRLERRSVFRNFVDVSEREDLESTAVGQDRFVPAHESMQAAQFGDEFAGWTQSQMIGVAKQYLRAGFGHLINC